MLILDDLNQCGLNKSRPKRFFFRKLGLKWSYRQFKSRPATKRQKYPDQILYYNLLHLLNCF